MSQENVEIVRRLYEAFETRDNVSPFEFYDPEIEWYPGVPDVGFEPVYRGHDGVREFWRSFLASWESIEFRLDELIDAGDEVVALIWEVWTEWRVTAERFIDVGDKVVTIETIRGRGRGSGVETEGRYASIWTLQHGRVTRVEVGLDPQEALKAVGLEE